MQTHSKAKAGLLFVKESSLCCILWCTYKSSVCFQDMIQKHFTGGGGKKTQPKFSCLVTDSSWKERIFNSQRGMAGNLRQSNPLTSKCQASFKLDVPSFRFSALLKQRSWQRINKILFAPHTCKDGFLGECKESSAPQRGHVITAMGNWSKL